MSTSVNENSLPPKPIKRIIKRLSVKELITNKGVEIVPYAGPSISEVSKLTFVPLSQLHFPYILPAELSSDLLWEISWNFKMNQPQWSGFMSAMKDTSRPKKTDVHFLPIIDMNPSDETCIYSTLLYVEEQAKQLELPIATITFDQPLWFQAVGIIEAKDMNISPLN